VKFFEYLLFPIFPKRYSSRLPEEKRRTAYAALLLLILGALYTVTVCIGWRNGYGAVMPPVLNIPAEKYYFYAMFFNLPVFFCIAIVFAGAGRLVAAAFGGVGDFETLFAVFAASLALPLFIFMWLPETILFLTTKPEAGTLGGFPGLPPALDNARMLLGIVWTIVISVYGIAECEKLGVLKSAAVGLGAYAPAAALVFVFIR
jgi:hypothetical protein